MCIAVAARVVSVEGDKRTMLVDWAGNRLHVDARLVDAREGDYVMVHAGCALEVVTALFAAELEELHSLLKDALHE